MVLTIWLSISLISLTLPSTSFPAQEKNDTIGTASRLIEEGQSEKAIEYLTIAIRNDPGNAGLYFWIGIAYYKTGEDQKAEESFNAALKIDPTDPRIHYNLGALYFREKKWDHAIMSFLNAANLAPDWKAHSYLNIGLIYYKKGLGEKAIDWFQKTLRENPPAATEQMARYMLNLLSPMKKHAKRGIWNTQTSMAREFDTNVFLSSAEQVATGKEDWATVGSFYLNYQLPVHGNIFILSPGYYLFGRWYDLEGRDYNYLLHDLILTLESPAMKIHPRLGYSYMNTRLGNRPFLEVHQISFTSQILKSQKNVTRLGGTYSIDNALNRDYNYLSGDEWKIGLTNTTPIYGNKGYIYLSLAILRSNLSDFKAPAQFSSYSYEAIEPSIQIQFPLVERFNGRGLFTYQHRSYLDVDTWSTGRKKRRDEIFTAGFSVLRPLFKYLETEFKYWTRINLSNIGDDPADYADRDYQKGIYSLSLKATF